jgi:hypothetical protein
LDGRKKDEMVGVGLYGCGVRRKRESRASWSVAALCHVRGGTLENGE